MALAHIDSVSDPRLEDYRNVRDRDLLRARGLFVVEGRENVRRLIADSPFEPRSLLLSRPAHAALTDSLAALDADVPVFVGSRETLSAVAGFDLHRGCLAAVDRGPPRDPASLLARDGSPSVVVVLEGLGNPDNVGSVFRNARAFGVDAVLCDPHCCDPFYRKAIRVSMGAVLCLPSARFECVESGLELLREAGYRTVALDPEAELEIGSPAWSARAADLRRVALVLGTEGPGLSASARAHCDEAHRIGMDGGVDSLNVATACAIALHHFRELRGLSVGRSGDG